MYKYLFILSVLTTFILAGCSDTSEITSPEPATSEALALHKDGATVVNGWYEEDEIYYIDAGVEEGVTERGENQIYVIGSVPRGLQAQVVLHIPGEPGYTPHWNVNFVHTAVGKTVQDIIDAGFASENYHISGGENVLFDDAEDIFDAQASGLVTIERPGAVVLCPIVAEAAADAPGNTEAPEDKFPEFPETF